MQSGGQSVSHPPGPRTHGRIIAQLVMLLLLVRHQPTPHAPHGRVALHHCMAGRPTAACKAKGQSDKGDYLSEGVTEGSMPAVRRVIRGGRADHAGGRRNGARHGALLVESRGAKAATSRVERRVERRYERRVERARSGVHIHKRQCISGWHREGEEEDGGEAEAARGDDEPHRLNERLILLQVAAQLFECQTYREPATMPSPISTWRLVSSSLRCGCTTKSTPIHAMHTPQMMCGHRKASTSRRGRYATAAAK